MGRIHGKRGRIYMGIASDTAVAEPLPFIAAWAIRHPTARSKVTAMGDRHDVYVNGMPDCTGMFRGWIDDSTAQTYTAAIDGLPRKMYLYPDLNSNTKYFFGTIVVDFTEEGGVDGGGVALNADWGAASDIFRQGQ